MVSQRVLAGEWTERVAAPAGVVYGLLADAVRWPLLLSAPVHVERLDFDGALERLRLWDVADERVRSCHVRRILDARSRTVAFEQEDVFRPGLPVKGTWAVEADGPDGCRLSLRQECVPEPLAGLEGAAFQGATVRQLGEVKESAERWERLDELLMSFEDGVHVDGPAEVVYDFLHRIEDWPDLLPHVDAAAVTEDVPGVQIASVETCAAPDGLPVTVRTVRLCFPSAARIVSKELRPPELVAAHTGEWSLEPEEGGVRVVRTQRVMLREEAVEPLLGPGTGLAEARRYVRSRLGRAANETLRMARWHALSAVRRLR
jgi:aromatase